MTMMSRIELAPIAFLLRVLTWSGVLAMFVSVPMGIEEGPIPADQLIRKKRIATMVLFTGGGVAALAAFGRYAIDRPRHDPLEEETRR